MNTDKAKAGKGLPYLLLSKWSDRAVGKPPNDVGYCFSSQETLYSVRQCIG